MSKYGGISIAAAAARLGVSVPTLRDWERRGLIRFKRISARIIRVDEREIRRVERGEEEKA